MPLAEALDCRFVYGFVPRESLEKMVEENAKTLAAKRMNRTNQTMRLEKQELGTKKQEEALAQCQDHCGINMMKIDYPGGATPLRDEDLKGLIPSHITTRSELDEYEQYNIDDAQYWIENKDLSEDEIAARFHHKLVWIHLFPNRNGRHARLVTDILLENVLGRPAFTWGSKSLSKTGEGRTTYIESLQAADSFSCDYKPLLEFVRSSSEVGPPFRSSHYHEHLCKGQG